MYPITILPNWWERTKFPILAYDALQKCNNLTKLEAQDDINPSKRKLSIGNSISKPIATPLLVATIANIDDVAKAILPSLLWYTSNSQQEVKAI